MIYGPRASLLGHKSMGENLVRNFQYGPRTRLVRGTIKKETKTFGDIQKFYTLL